MSAKHYKAIIFDLDGTLIDNRSSFRNAFGKLCQYYPNVLNEESTEQCKSLIQLYHVTDPDVKFQHFCQKYHWHPHPSYWEFWELWSTLYLISTTPFPWTVDTLEYLKQRGYLLGIITNGESFSQREKLKHSSLINYFDHIVVSAEQGITKPAADIYRISANALKVEISECLFVGDRPETDVAGANNAGMDCLLVGQHEDVFEKATYTAENISYLQSLLTM